MQVYDPLSVFCSFNWCASKVIVSRIFIKSEKKLYFQLEYKVSVCYEDVNITGFILYFTLLIMNLTVFHIVILLISL